MPPRLTPAILLLALATSLPAAGPPRPSPTAYGDRMLRDYFRRQVKQIAAADLTDVRTKEDWERKRPETRRQLLDMLGLWPMPKRTPLKATMTGTLSTPDFTVEKLHFQSIPGLYVTANLYLPRKARLPAPGVLYLCGHSPVVIDKVPYGNKVAYQRHGAWFAANGYVCLVLDTLQLGEVPGLHHGTHHLNMWWWQSLGYTPAGVECWNAIRALDYLQTRKEVDAKRIGVTGRSGGGAGSWWVAAADDRVKCAVPVAGIGDLWAHVCEGDAPRFRDGVISGHCDCMYFVNTHRWDFSRVMALCAPRPLLLGNSDRDEIFPVPGYRRLAGKVRRLYHLYGADDRFALLETHGPHKDTPELRKGAFAWMNRWLKGEKGPVSDPERPRLTPQQLKVLDHTPSDAINATAHLTFLKAAKHEVPESASRAKAWWPETAEAWRKSLRERVFAGWPRKPPALDVRPAGDVTHDDLRLRAFDFVSEEGVPLRVWVLTQTKVEKPSLVVLSAVDESGWQDWVQGLGRPFREILYGKGNPPPNPYPARSAGRFEQLRRTLGKHPWAFAFVAPRGVGPTRWSEVSPYTGKPAGQHVLRRFALIGQTLDGQRVWDVRRAVACVKSVDDLKGAPLWLEGKGQMAGVALYAGLFEPGVARLDLWHPPASHRQGPTLLNVLRVLDMPQAVALVFPRQVKVYVKDDAEAKAWDWPLRLQNMLGKEYVQIRKVGG